MKAKQKKVVQIKATNGTKFELVGNRLRMLHENGQSFYQTTKAQIRKGLTTIIPVTSFHGDENEKFLDVVVVEGVGQRRRFETFSSALSTGKKPFFHVGCMIFNRPSTQAIIEWARA